MTLKQDFAFEARRPIVRGMMFEKLTKEKCLVAQLLSTRIGRKEVAEFIAEHGSTARFQNDDWQAGVNWSNQHAEYALQIFFGFVQEAEIIKRASTTQMSAGNSDAEPRASEHTERCPDRLRMEVVVKGVCP